MTGPLSILIVTAGPDRRRSTEMLHLLVDHLARRPELTVTTWFLRAGDTEPWPGSRVVDDLRTWWPSRVIGRRNERLAGAVRGIRLRQWLREVRPDVVVLDDGLGDRVLDGWRRPVVRAIRVNPVGPAAGEMEPPPRSTGDVVIWSRPGRPEPGDVAHLELPELRDCAAARSMVDPRRRSEAIRRLGLPEGVPLVVGWGEDGWLDGTDLFIRSMWALSARHGVEPHALWLGLSSDRHEADRLRTEAGRCGLGDRFHLRPLVEDSDRYLGDAVLLPSRVAGDPEPMTRALASGLVVVTSDVEGVPPGVTTIPPLDVEAAANALRDALGGDRPARAEHARLLDAELWLDHEQWADRFVRLVRG